MKTQEKRWDLGVEAVLSLVGPVVTCRSCSSEPMTLRLERQVCACTRAILPSSANVSAS